MEIMYSLQKSNGTGTGCSIGTSTGDSTGTCTGDITGMGTCEGAQDVDYFLTTDGLVRFKDKIYVPDSSELKKVILREFHVKPYLGHPRYPKTLTTVKIFYY